MDLSLDDLVDLAAPALPRGKRDAVPPVYSRDLRAEDFPTILGSQGGVKPPPLQRLRTTHHLAARCVAQGMSHVEASLVTGYAPNRVSLLCQDPTFQELVEHYKGRVEEQWVNVQERLAALGIALTEELQQRLDEVPESFSNEELRRWAETVLDRGGYGPRSTTNVNVRGSVTALHLVEQVKREQVENTTVRFLTAAE